MLIRQTGYICSRRRALVLAVVLLVLGLSVGSSRASAVEEGAEAFVISLSQKAITELTDTAASQEERQRRFRILLNDHFDVETIGMWVLGRYWRKATPTERSDYLVLFEDLIVITYLNRFDQYVGEKISILKSAANDSDSVTVYSQLISPDQTKAIQIDWRIAVRDDLFRVVDVVVEGISMSQTQRSEFSSVIRRNGGAISGLLAELRKKVGVAP